MDINSCMKRNVVFIPESTTIGEAAALMVEKHIGILPVVDAQQKPVGVIRLSDLLSLELPDFVNLIEDLDFIHDFGAVETALPGAAQLDQPVTTLLHPEEVIEEGSGLMRTYALMVHYHTYDLPVVDSEGKLVGVVSRVDIGTAILSQWPVKGEK